MSDTSRQKVFAQSEAGSLIGASSAANTGYAWTQSVGAQTRVPNQAILSGAYLPAGTKGAFGTLFQDLPISAALAQKINGQSGTIVSVPDFGRSKASQIRNSDSNVKSPLDYGTPLMTLQMENIMGQTRAKSTDVIVSSTPVGWFDNAKSQHEVTFTDVSPAASFLVLGSAYDKQGRSITGFKYGYESIDELSPTNKVNDFIGSTQTAKNIASHSGAIGGFVANIGRTWENKAGKNTPMLMIGQATEVGGGVISELGAYSSKNAGTLGQGASISYDADQWYTLLRTLYRALITDMSTKERTEIALKLDNIYKNIDKQRRRNSRLGRDMIPDSIYNDLENMEISLRDIAEKAGLLSKKIDEGRNSLR
jgi:hypothetical protein